VTYWQMQEFCPEMVEPLLPPVHDAHAHIACPGHDTWHAGDMLPLPHVTVMHWHDVKRGVEPLTTTTGASAVTGRDPGSPATRSAMSADRFAR
jgi:hypothetical protein